MFRRSHRPWFSRFRRSASPSRPPPIGPLFATRPDFYGKATYTFDVAVDRPYSLIFYRANERSLLDVYKPETARQILEETSAGAIVPPRTISVTTTEDVVAMDDQCSIFTDGLESGDIGTPTNTFNRFKVLAGTPANTFNGHGTVLMSAVPNGGRPK